MSRQFLMLSWFTLVFVLFSTAAFSSEESAAVARDLAPMAGVVVMPAGEEYLIDLDAAKGVREGDLLAVVAPGEKIVHPVTKAVLGSLDRVKGYLQVSRVKSGYSYARPLDQTPVLARGDQLRRFEQLPAQFWDYTGQGEELFTELRSALPGLDWQGYAATQAKRPDPPRALGDKVATLIFILDDRGLSVKDGALTSLGFYPRSVATQPVPAAAAAIAAPVPVPSASALAIEPAPAGEVAAGSGIVAVGGRSEPGVWYSPELPGEPAGLVVGDFDGDGRQETAIAFSDSLLISRLAGTSFQTLSTIPLEKALKVVAVDAADLTGDGRPEIYLTAVDGQALESLVVEWHGGSYQITMKKIAMFFRTVDLPGEGPILLGQVMGSGREDFSGPVFRVERTGQDLRKGAALALPPLIDLYGFVPFVAEGGRTLYASLNINSELQVHDPSGDRLWKSGDQFGGREAFIPRPDTDVVLDKVTRSLFLKANLKLGPKGEILVPRNEGTRLFGNYRKFESSELKALAWDGRALKELWHTRPQSGYLSDFTVADVDNDGTPELAMSVLFSHEGVKSKGRSGLVVYDLQ